MKATNIQWDIDEGDMNALPTEIEIPEGMTDEEEISDYLSDITGYCHKGFVLDNEVRFKDLKPYAFRIHDYCSKIHHCQNMMSTLDADLAVDSYQDTQPGGGNCVSGNRKEFNEYEKELFNLTAESVFGELYQQASLEGKALLENFLSECEKRYCDTFMLELDSIYQVGNFLSFVD